MHIQHKSILALCGFSGLFVVVKGALAAHHYPGFMDAYALEIIQTGLQFQMFHTLAAMFICLLFSKNHKQSGAVIPAALMLFGILLFSGSLYLLAFKNNLPDFVISIAGPVTPIGGLCLMLGWGVFIWKVLK